MMLDTHIPSVAFSLGGAAFCLAIEIEGAKMSTEKGSRGDISYREKDKETLGFPFRLLGLVRSGSGEVRP